MEEVSTNEFKQYIVVKLANEQYGIDIQYVDNIVRMQKVTRVPKSQDYFKGVINIHDGMGSVSFHGKHHHAFHILMKHKKNSGNNILRSSENLGQLPKIKQLDLRNVHIDFVFC